MGIQAGSEGSRTKKLSHRGQERGTGVQEALVVHLPHGGQTPGQHGPLKAPRRREAGVG